MTRERPPTSATSAPKTHEPRATEQQPDRAHLDVRAQLCGDLGLAPVELPYAGELLDVSEEYAEWRGAAERVLRGFALSLLVPQQHYPAVARWMNNRRLTSRGPMARRGKRSSSTNGCPDTSGSNHRARRALLIDCTEVNGPFESLPRDQLAHRADHRVRQASTSSEPRRAVTREGQVRCGDRHEKDDRSRIDDPRPWVLGWANERKIDASDRAARRGGERARARLAPSGEAHRKAESAAGRPRWSRSRGGIQSWADLDVDEADAANDTTRNAPDCWPAPRLDEIERQLGENAEQAAAEGR